MAVATKKKKIFDDRYEILNIIGRGSQSVVYQAKNIIEGGPEVALKVLSKKKGDIPNSERLRKEALAMVSCNHRYVVHLDDFHTIGDVSYLSMELAQERDLRRFIEKMGGRLDPTVIKRFFAQTIEAIDYIHKVGIIHRDIKPDNILVLNEQEIRLGDFGIAILPGETPVSKDAQLGVGTMDYLSPEILEGRQFSVLSDLYSLGICFYEVMTGKTPFADVPLMQQLEARKNHHVKALSNTRKDLPPYLTNIILKMLQFNPADRFQNAGDILKALQAGDNGRPVIATSPAVQKEKISTSSATAKEVKKQEASKPAATPAAKTTIAPIEATPAKALAPDMTPPVQPTAAKVTQREAPAPHVTAPQVSRDQNIMQEPKSSVNTGGNTTPEKLKESGEEVSMIRKSPDAHSHNPQHLRASTPSGVTDSASRRDIAAQQHYPKANPHLLKFVFIGIAIICAAMLLRRAMNRIESPQDQEIAPATEIAATDSFADAVTGRSFDFTRIKPGIYAGMTGGIIPGQEVPLSIIAPIDSRSITVMIGVEGWMPQTISLDSERLLKKPYALRVASNGFVIELLATGEITPKLVKGEVDNIITGERAAWLLMPQM